MLTAAFFYLFAAGASQNEQVDYRTEGVPEQGRAAPDKCQFLVRQDAIP